MRMPISGQKETALLETKAKKGSISHYQFALIYVGLGDKEQGLAALEKAFQERSTLLTHSKMDPTFEPIRSDVRFTDIQRRIGLPP